MTIFAALAGGFVGTLVLTTMMQAATEFRLTRIDLPFLLGTAVTMDRARARLIGYALHFFFGLAFAAAYYAIFAAIGEASWWLGGALGLLHGLFAGTGLVNILLPAVHPRMGTINTDASRSPLLEPPGFLLLNYGPSTPLVMVCAHIVYGVLVGAAAAPS